MSTVESTSRVLEEIADLFASAPTREEILAFRPSDIVQERARDLLDQSAAGRLSVEDESDLEQFHIAETLMRLVKARLRSKPVQ
jgi:hypothetical protein